jgi:predicted dehydrogenase
MNPTRVGIAGCGMIAGAPLIADRPILGSHAQACRDLGLVLTAACDPDERKRTAFATLWHPNALYADVEEMLDEARLDLLIVATPPDTHEAICLHAVAAGVRGILCEKPFTGRADSGRRVAEACLTARIPLVVNFNRRWDDSHQLLQTRIANGAVGEVRALSGWYTGTLRGNGSHMLDVIRMLCPGDWSAEWTSRLAAGASDGPVSVILRSTAGARAHIQAVIDAEYFIFELDVLGTRGRARLFNNGNEIHLEMPAASYDFPGYHYLQQVESLPKNSLPSSFARALDHLRNCVASGRPVAVSPSELVRTLELMDVVIARATLQAEDGRT